MTEKTHNGLPVAGYRPQTADKVALVDVNKAIEERLLRIVEELGSVHGSVTDPRMLAEARTCFQTGFMWLNRAVFQPGRLSDADLARIEGRDAP